MFKFNNTHIFTGYLKQLLSTFNLPTCKVYTREFTEYKANHGVEDPRVIESFADIFYTNRSKAEQSRPGVVVNYLKQDGIYNYFLDFSKTDLSEDTKINYVTTWCQSGNHFYDGSRNILGLTRTLTSPGPVYDKTTHEYLGEYLRFLRDYYGVNLMSMYNCFNNTRCHNIYYELIYDTIPNPDYDDSKEVSTKNPRVIDKYRIFDSRNSSYSIYAIPVKLFNNYTIAIESNSGIELFCGLYSSSLDISSKGQDLIKKTYTKINKTLFNQPYLYNKLGIDFWNFALDTEKDLKGNFSFTKLDTITRWDIINREQDLKLFIKVPTSCKSSIVVLEGDYRGFNDFKYELQPHISSAYSQIMPVWSYQQNTCVINFDKNNKELINKLNSNKFTPISKLQLLAFNTGESYPFADRLVEYLSNSAITPLDPISDNIKRAQAVMEKNQQYFKIPGIWENKMQKIIYDYIMNTGPVEIYDTDKLVTVKSEGTDKKYLTTNITMQKNPQTNNYSTKCTKTLILPEKKASTVAVNLQQGRYPKLGYGSKSSLYDILVYVDKDAEKWYANWSTKNGKPTVTSTIQNTDIYNGLYDI